MHRLSDKCTWLTGSQQADWRGARKKTIQGDGNHLRVFEFMKDAWRDVPLPSFDVDIHGGHGGGDYGLMDAFLRAVAENDPSCILSGPDETLDSHLMVFAAERARIEHRVIDL